MAESMTFVIDTIKTPLGTAILFGSLTGYGGGLPRKRWLLEHEARHTTFRLEVSA